MRHPLLGAAVALADGTGVLFTGRLSTSTHPWLADHTVAGRTVVPGTALVELVARAGAELGCDRIAELVMDTPSCCPNAVPPRCSSSSPPPTTPDAAR